MKKAFLPLFCFLLSSISTFAQTDYSGTWNGAIELPGRSLGLSIELKKASGTWTGVLNIPEQSIKGMQLADLDISDANMRFNLPEVPGSASFSGKFNGQADLLEGTFSQSGMSFPMRLTLESATKKAETERHLQEVAGVLRHLADSLRQKRLTPGLGLGIVMDGKVILADGFGYRNLEQKQPVTANTQFAIGSSSKAFTAAVLAILADRGLLEWDKPVVQYMPDFKLYDDFATREMTAVDLVCHRSGLPRHDLMWYGSPFSRKDIYERLRYLPPNKSLRTTWQYNNLMFMTAGYLAGRISGSNWEELVKTNVFQPLGMNTSNFSVKDMAAAKDAATGYRTKDKKENIRMEYRNIDAIGPAGSINSTVNDMLQWVSLHLNNGKARDRQVISAAEVKHLHTPQMLMDGARLAKDPELTDASYAMGWFVHRHKGLQVVQHGGNIDGFSALVYLVPEKNFGLVILTNQNGSGLPTVLARYATDLVLNLEPTDWYQRMYGEGDKQDEEKKEDEKPEPRRIAGTRASHAMIAYAGEYAHPGYGVVEIREKAGNLHLKYNGFDLPLEHWHYDVFRAVDETIGGDFMLNFQTDQNGNVYQMTTAMDPLSEDMVFKKQAPRRLSDPAFLQNLAGKYKMDKTETRVTIEARNQILYATVPGQPTYTLEPFQGTEFKIKELNGYSVEFQLGPDNKATAISLIQPEGVFGAKREE
jgi:CubicO group peptidase (beta-lactamase class C family)